ncbi:hypothetical protein [Metabacillus indicus]|uniref:hypothetical protein n=1 Tax=Metabacillus indicus TaxID=246786 RepID=UPI001267D503|nr:hypothetical protein [Metabacillus indicus]
MSNLAIKFNELEERKLFVAMYLLFKGITLLDDVNTAVLERIDSNDEKQKMQVKEFSEKIIKVAQARARIDDEYILTEDENEAERREEIEDEIYKLLEENFNNEKVKTLLSS